MGVQERNKPKDDALMSNVGIGVGDGATIRERRAGRATGRGKSPRYSGVVLMQCLSNIQVEMTNTQLGMWICH